MLPTATCIKEECVSNSVCLIIAQPKILKSGPCSLEALYIFVIERSRDLIYLKFVATDFFPKIISPSAGKNSGDLA